MAEPRLAKSSRALRAEVEQLIRDDLIGPRAGEQEELREPPIDEYLLGVLAPRLTVDRGSAWQGTAPTDDPDEDSAAADSQPEDNLADATADSGEEGSVEDRPPAAEQLRPSSFGLTFALDGDCDELRVEASWGAYSKQTSEEKTDAAGRPVSVWRRRQCGGTHTIAVGHGGTIKTFAPDPDEEQVVVRGMIRERHGHRLVSLFLINAQQAEGGRSVQLWLCQASLSVCAPDGAPVFVRRAIDPAALAPQVDRAEIEGLEMLHRSSVELAAGHGVAVQATPAPDAPGRGVRLQTAAMPAEEVPRTDAPAPEDFADDAIARPFGAALPALDMKTLGEASDGELQPLLTPLVDAYEAWIAAQQARIADPGARLEDHERTAHEHLDRARAAATRIRAGIDALADPDVAEAFRFANHAMHRQRVHTIAADARRRDGALKLHDAVASADIARNRSWRPFQLAFVLLNLPALADPAHEERRATDGLLDLLFFPTGGGKTEAYLGLTAFAIAIRRLQGVVEGRDGRDGVAVLMRYTLRLLTLQQFQRAAALLCACELRRRALYADGRTERERRWGRTPMRIGLWVGQASTPNRTDDAGEWVRQARQRGDRSARGSSPLQLARCPWCGSELQGGRDVEVDARRGRTLLTCSDTSGACPFTPRDSRGEGLPVVVVDEEVYRLVPSLVIATVDKLARMPWEGRAQALFGRVSRYCERHKYLTPSEDHEARSHPARGGLDAATVVECAPLRPPDLIIQDELHLISGPLGSLVGLYETAVDELCSWEVGGERVRPKVVASTATIRRADVQVARLFRRKLAVFPPPGLDARDSFFALQRDRPAEQEAKPGRRFLGICAPGQRYKHVLIRVYVAQLRAAWTMLGRQPGEQADAYMTLVGYFNSLRELGGMRRLVEDDVQNRLFSPGAADNRGRLILEELTSRKSAAEIPGTLDQLGARRLSQAKPAPAKQGDTSTPRSIDVLLATNMISVGVDVPRLGAMVVAGQPKSTSEYIQATSRVGREYPGLVMTVYNWARPRDLSHYETFCHYHRTLYRQVEALSVTPFAARALDRGLTGVLASLLRLHGATWNPNAGAGLVDPANPRMQQVVRAIRERAADQVGQREADDIAERATRLLELWKVEADKGQRTLVYQRRGRAGTDVSLLQQPGIMGWSQWTVPNSLRNVETAIPLALRETGIAAATEEWEAPERSAPIPKTTDDG